MFPPQENGSTYVVELDAASVAASKGFMIVDLSDTTRWKHINTGKILIYDIHVNLAMDSTFKGRFDIGWLSGISATNGDFHYINSYKLETGTAGIAFGDSINFGGVDKCFECATTLWYGRTALNDTTWQSDVQLTGPAGITDYPAGNGDLVCKVTRTAGTISFGLTVIYTTIV